MGHESRVSALRGAMNGAGAALSVIGLSANMRYLTGFIDEQGERQLLLLIPAKGEALLVVPELYADQVRLHNPPATIHTWSDGDDPTRIVDHQMADTLRGQEGRILIDDTLWAMFLLPIEQLFSERDFGLVSEVVTPLRMCKTEEEIAAMRKAGEIADTAFEDAVAEAVAGCTELQMAGRLEASMLDHGADGIAFETLVASGPNSALPHHRAGGRRIGAGDIVILDYGCRVDGYCSDISRTIVCGEPTEEMEQVHDAVQRAHWAARERVGIGIQAEEVDAAARDVLTSTGYGEQFVHRTGHGIGLDVHEPPYIVRGNAEVLKKGMSFSIEPGAYLTGSFGVRIEDVVVVETSGAVSMTVAPQELRRVP